MKRSVKTESTVFVGAFVRKTLVWKWILRVGRHDCVKVADFCFIFKKRENVFSFKINK